MTEPQTQTQTARVTDVTPLVDDIRSIVAEMLDSHARSSSDFLLHIEKYERVAKTVTGTVALPEWIRGETIKDGNGPNIWKPRSVAEQEKIALSVILAGAELGLPPMVSLRHIFLVEGKVGLSAEIMLNLAIRAGLQFKWLESTAEKATLWLKRHGQDAHKQDWTIQEARTAKLGEKFNWKSYPAAMLRARAISAACRAYCPDVTNGCYTPEELDDLEVAARPPDSLDTIAAMGVRAGDDGPIAVKLIARAKAATADDFASVVSDANKYAGEMDGAEIAAVKLAVDAAKARLSR